MAEELPRPHLNYVQWIQASCLVTYYLTRSGRFLEARHEVRRCEYFTADCFQRLDNAVIVALRCLQLGRLVQPAQNYLIEMAPDGATLRTPWKCLDVPKV